MSGTSRRTMMGIDPDVWSICTGTDSTMSDMTGPGRLVGNLISRGGRRIEALAGYVAHKLGSGPYAVLARILTPAFCPEHAADKYHPSTVHWNFEYFCKNPSQRTLIRYLGFLWCSKCRDCLVEGLILQPLFAAHKRELLQLARSHDTATQSISIRAIYLLICFHHAFREYLSPLAILALARVTKDPFSPVEIREAASYVHRLLVDNCFYQDQQPSLLGPGPGKWRDDTLSVTFAQVVKLSRVHCAVLGSDDVNIAVSLQLEILTQQPKLPLTMSPPRSVIMGIMSTASYPELLYFDTFMTCLESCIGAGKANTMDWRTASADLYIPVLQHRINFTRRSLLLECFWLPQIPPAVKERLITQGNTLMVTNWIHGGDELPVQLRDVIRWDGVLPPGLVDWLQQVIDAFETPWLPEDNSIAPTLVHGDEAGQTVDVGVAEEITGVKRRGGRRSLMNTPRMETIMEEDDTENSEDRVL